MNSLSALLTWLTGADAGAFVLVSGAVALFLEDVDKWNALQSKIRFLIILGASALLGVGASFLAQYPDVVLAIEPYFRPVMYTVLAWLSTQTLHKLDKVAKFFSNTPG